ncbi:MAG: FAD synthetase family protein [Alphaproteobacteria bacterium]|nr:FAD synthetase family protein [Alphaproteobacteria bacterium]MBU2229923.1 FAD synthetase family protein [Alphaproteobacteria bacterium]
MGPDFSGQPTQVVTDRQIVLSGCVLAIGAFDGVHRGHQRLIAGAIADARAAGLPAVVWTFDPPPKVFFGRAIRLSPLHEKLARIAALGPDWITVASFNATYAARSAESFIADLARIAPRRIHVGADFRFGARQSGDVGLLARHFDLALAEPVICAGGEVISSSRIRTLKMQGRAQDAATLLAAPPPLFQLGGGLQTLDMRLREDRDAWI